MGLKVFSILQNSNLRYSALAGIVFCLTATTTHAGFEWIPGDTPASPPATVERAPAQPATQDLLMHDMAPPRPVPAQPAASPMLPPLPEPEPVLKVKDMAATPQNLKPVVEQEAVPAPMAPIPTQRVIMPQDAPQSARTNVPDSQVLKINPFPMQEAMLDAAEPPAKPEPEPMAKIMGEPMPMQSATTPDAVGFGNDIPLALALQQIAPAGYAFSFGENINPGVKVSWTGGKAWTAVMQDMITPLGLKADVRGKSIVIRNQQHSAAMPPPNFIEPAAGNSAEPVILTDTPGIRRQAIQDPGTVALEQPTETIEVIEGASTDGSDLLEDPSKEASIWEATQGDSLKQTLSLWSKKASFDVEWKATHDYVLVSNVLVAGNFDSALKALLVNSLSRDDRPDVTFVQSPEGQAISKIIIEDPAPSAS